VAEAVNQPEQPQMRSSEEFDLIASIRERLGSQPGERARVGIGDDAAVTVPGGATATTIDAIVEGVHFRSSWCPPRAVGERAMATALSDLAAMGAEPGEAYVWLGRPEWLDRESCLALCDGLAVVAREAGVAVLGGDLTASPALAVCVTAVGHAEREGELVGRAGARPGDAICLSGSIGGAGAGLLALSSPELVAGVPEELRAPAIARLLAPRPRLELGRALARAGASAMIDVSDGLGADAEHLAAASEVGIEIDLGLAPLGAGVEAIAAAAGRDPLELAAGAGDDYELLCAIPPGRVEVARRAAAEVGIALTEVGRCEKGSEAVRLNRPGGGVVAPGGHDHLRG
jgi:thiamine-monophosphate kinase